MSFENIIGNNNQKELLIQAIKQNKILHSYMFIGKDGIGKKLFALEFAKMILCQANTSKPCNSCKSCIEFNSNNHPDMEIIYPEGKTIKIETIRNLQNKISEKPVLSDKKVYIIDDSNLMTKEAQNCLLKTLEEPPQYMVLILITSNEANILNTIKSRCTKILFNNLTDEEILKYLKNEVGINNISKNILGIIDGSIGKGLNIKDNISTYEQIEDFVSNLETIDKIDIFNKTDIINKNKENIMEILEYMNVIFFNLAKEKKYQYLNCIEIIEETKKRLLFNANFDMSIDNMLLKLWEEINEKHYRS